MPFHPPSRREATVTVPAAEDAAHEIWAGLLQPQASISPKYFYDERGSELFEEITRLPEYYVTRTERAIMDRCGAEMAAAIGDCASVIELGAGSCEKAIALCRLLQPRRFVAVDISGDFLLESAQALRRAMPGTDVHAVVADITRPFALPVEVPRARRLVFYPGTSIGNFDPPHARELLGRARSQLDDDGALLIGIDLAKDPPVLEAAYNDAQGVTAAFNLNMLTHVNRLAGTDFDESQWSHRAWFNRMASRIEMHLHARRDIWVHWPGGARAFVEGESIQTEHSYKFDPGAFGLLLQQVGFRHQRMWTDDRRWFAVILAKP